MPHTTLYTSPRLNLFSNGPVVVGQFSAPPQVIDVEKMEAAFERVIKAQGKVCYFMVIAANETKVDEQARARIGQMLKKIDPQLLGTATVLQMDGLKGTILRTFITGVNMLARTKAPSKVVASLAEARAWLEKLPGQPADIHDRLDEVVRELEPRAHAA